MQQPVYLRIHRRAQLFFYTTLVMALLAFSACGGISFELSDLPFAGLLFSPTPTFTPTPLPTSTPTPQPTSTPRPGELSQPATPTPISTPQVTIPEEYTPYTDSKLGYSLAVPSGWSPFDLRSSQFQTMVNTFGLSEQMAPLNDFLNSPAGQNLGVIYATDLMGVMFGGLPTLLNVTVVPEAEALTPDALLVLLQRNIETNARRLGDVTIRNLNTAVINNIPGVRASAIADLSQAGIEQKLFVKVAALVANNKLYILTLATEEGKMAEKEPDFDTIIGTFRPE